MHAPHLARAHGRRGLVMVLAAGLFPAPALAATVLLPPLLAGRGTAPDKAKDVTALMSSELEFMAGVDELIELDTRPASFDVACLASTACLSDLAEEHMADRIVAGQLEAVAGGWTLDLLFYDADINRVLRRNTFAVPSDSAALLDVVSSALGEIVTGRAPEAVKAEAGLSDVSFDEGLDDTPPPAPPPPPVAPPPMEEFDPDAFSFADPGAITFGDAAAQITFGEPATPPAPPPAAPPPPADPPPRATTPAPSRYADAEDDDDDDDLGRPSASSSRSSTPSRSTTTRKPGGDPYDALRRVTITARGGYLNYGAVPKETNPESPRYDPAFTGFHFVDIGAELGVRMVKGLHFVAGVDIGMVRRALPADQIQEGGKTTETNLIFPINAGLLYRINAGRVRPYLGADAIFSHIRTACIDVSDGACEGLADPEQAATLLRDVDYVVRQNWAVGGRGRLGVDIMVTPAFGLNLDVALGYWTSRDWPNVDPRQPTGGFLPRVGGGFALAF